MIETSLSVEYNFLYVAYLFLLTSVLMQYITHVWCRHLIYWEHYVISPLHEGEAERVGLVGGVYLCLILPKIKACDKVLFYS
jgi:hypothetical protein